MKTSMLESLHHKETQVHNDLSIDHTYFVFPYFSLLLLIIAIMRVAQKVYKNEDFFTFLQ